MVIGRFGALTGCITDNILVGPPLTRLHISSLLLYLQIELCCHLINRITPS